jgi:hypothetical protein
MIKILNPIGTSSKISTGDDREIKSPLDDFNGRKTKEYLNN